MAFGLVQKGEGGVKSDMSVPALQYVVCNHLFTKYGTKYVGGLYEATEIFAGTSVHQALENKVGSMINVFQIFAAATVLISFGALIGKASAYVEN